MGGRVESSFLRILFEWSWFDGGEFDFRRVRWARVFFAVALCIGLLSTAPVAAFGEDTAGRSAVSDANFHQLVIVL